MTGKISLFNMLVDTFKDAGKWPSKAQLRYFKRLNRNNKRQMAQFKRRNRSLKKAIQALKQCTDKYFGNESFVKWVEETDGQGNKTTVGRLDCGVSEERKEPNDEN